MFGFKARRIRELQDELYEVKRENRELKRCLNSYQRHETKLKKTEALKHLLTVINEPRCSPIGEGAAFENISIAFDAYVAQCLAKDRF